jgi:hypothetical protein
VAEHVVYVWRGLHLWLEEASLAKREGVQRTVAGSGEAPPTSS